MTNQRRNRFIDLLTSALASDPSESRLSRVMESAFWVSTDTAMNARVIDLAAFRQSRAL
jgi:hypothetical protein